MNILDGLIVLAALAYAIGGYRSGAIVGVFSLIGFFGGAVIGGQIARPLGSKLADGRAQVPVAIICVLVLATVGQLGAVWIGGRVRAQVVRGRGRPFDAAVGAVLGIVSVMLVAWMIAVPLASSPYPGLAGQASQSKIVRAVNGVVPNDFRDLYSSLRSYFDQSGFPPVFGDLPSTSIVDVPPPADLRPQARVAVARARKSVFKIYAQAPQCDRMIEGSGFVYAKHRILTNAHVVAGSSAVAIQVPGKQPVVAKVVLFDPKRDVAVLQVPGLDAPVLRPASVPAKSKSPAVVLGFPENGPFTVRSARVRALSSVNGRDIYNSTGVERSIYSIRSVVRSGNSGGPMIDDQGRVLGMVFATALDSPDTGFVLSNREIGLGTQGDASSGEQLTKPVATLGCTSG